MEEVQKPKVSVCYAGSPGHYSDGVFLYGEARYSVVAGAQYRVCQALLTHLLYVSVYPELLSFNSAFPLKLRMQCAR
jgi:hypothetical protein